MTFCHLELIAYIYFKEIFSPSFLGSATRGRKRAEEKKAKSFIKTFIEP